MMLRIAFALAACALLAGCETVVFEAPPVAAQACDPALVGHWLSRGEHKEKDGEVELRIDAQCRLLLVENEKDGRRESAPTTLHVGHDGRVGYAWVEARWAEQSLRDKPADGQAAPDSAFRESDLLLMRYRASARQLELRTADARQFAHAVIDGRIKGTVRREEDTLDVRVSAPVDPKPLRDKALFPEGSMHFVRAPAGG